MRNLDFSSWQSIGATLIGLALVTLIGVGIRLIVMMTIQQRRERMPRQINERLRVFIAAYTALGRPFPGTLAVAPTTLPRLPTPPVAAAPGSPAHTHPNPPRPL